MVSYKIGVCKVSPKGKDCTTKFEKLGYNGTTSVVLCKPLTGRMHQIRVHLQYLGEFLFVKRIFRSMSFIKKEKEASVVARVVSNGDVRD